MNSRARLATRATKTAVIGAGWAGLSAAYELASAGRHVTLYDMAPVAGGRARQTQIRLAGRRLQLDNGQHLLIGAYEKTLALIGAAAQAAPSESLLRLPLQFESGTVSVRRRGPGQLGLLFGILIARGLSLRSRAGIASFSLRLMAARWRTRPGETVTDLFVRLHQTPNAIKLFWTPMCLAALNTAPENACAQVFVNVLHDSLFASANSSDFLVPLVDLGTLLPESLLPTLSQLGVTIRLGTQVRRMTQMAEPGKRPRWRLESREAASQFDQVVLASSATQSAQLLSEIAPAAARALDRLQFESIQTVFVAWPLDRAPSLGPIRMLDQDNAAGYPGQWLFSRAAQDGLALASVIVSAPLPEQRLGNQVLATQVCQQLVDQLGIEAPLDASTIHEKKATFRCSIDRPIADHQQVDGNPLPEGLRLAGDYCWARYPATLESAVLSGAAAATDLLN